MGGRGQLSWLIERGAATTGSIYMWEGAIIGRTHRQKYIDGQGEMGAREL